MCNSSAHSSIYVQSFEAPNIIRHGSGTAWAVLRRLDRYLGNEQRCPLAVIKLCVFAKCLHLRYVLGDLEPEAWDHIVQLLQGMDFELVILLFKQRQ